MITTVTQKNMIAIPAALVRQFGIRPGYRFDWQPVGGRDEILVRVIPDRNELARRLLGTGRRFSPERSAVDELIAERAAQSVDAVLVHRDAHMRGIPVDLVRQKEIALTEKPQPSPSDD